ncbi:MAG: SCO family protein [Leptospiraceae bacterium]|nr:SCO family protein [Leptospiraceae bacterium]
MKKKFMMFLTFSGLVLFATSCKEHSHTDHSSHEGHGDHLMKAGTASDGSIYDLDNSWKTQENKEVKLSAFKGRPVIISMFYASCESICPRTISNMQGIQKEAQADDKKPVMIAASFDSKKDTPEALAKYAEKMKLTGDWYLLNGSEDSIRTLAVVLGINYEQRKDLEFNHSAVISLLNEQGNVVERIEGLNGSFKPILDTLKGL